MVGVVVTVVAGEIIKMKDIGNEFVNVQCYIFSCCELCMLEVSIGWKKLQASHQDWHKARKNSLALCKRNPVTDQWNLFEYWTWATELF